MAHQPIEELDLFRLFEEVADWTWTQVGTWPSLASRTIGEQLVRSVDSINANLVDGDGRYSTPDSLRFFCIARGSVRESRLWLRRAAKRNLSPVEETESNIQKLTQATRLLNQLIRYRREGTAGGVREIRESYRIIGSSSSPGHLTSDPFTGDPDECNP